MVIKLLSILLILVPAWAESAGGIQWNAPSTWKAQPQRPMRAATYAVPAVAGEEDAECAVFYFGPGQGGGVDVNISRWLGQFEGGASVTPKTRKQSVNGLNVTTVQHSGTYLAGAPMAPVKTPKPGYRLIGSIVEAPEGNVFFKMTGPAKTFASALSAFEKMVSTLERKGPRSPAPSR
ncbi:MAG: hypothetical protein JJE04_24795 [Acidobacteriia bacterium]|nr:hypothetical protein [Terriglobia bacterium]